MHVPPGACFCVPGYVASAYPVLSREQIIDGMVVKTGTDVMRGRVDAMGALLEAQSLAQQRKQARLDADPTLRKLEQGWWEHFAADTAQPPRYGCAEAYLHLGGAILLSEVLGYREVVLTFVGASIPRPDGQQKVRATVAQGDAKPATITVLNYAVPSSKVLGAVSMEVPSMDMLLSTMLDEQGFDIGIDGKSVIKIHWRGGTGARDRLRACVRRSRP